MTNRTMFGQETELALDAFSLSGVKLSPEDSVSVLFDQAVADLPHLRGEGGGLFLATGGRFYRDTGDHPEITTPEVTTPWEGVSYVRANEVILSRLAKSAKRNSRVAAMRIFKHNANYGPGGWATWGTGHESYNLSYSESGRDNFGKGRDFEATLIPFLVSRIVFAGAGGFNSRFSGLEFVISPRVPHLTCAISGNSTSDRPILHLREESLSSSNLNYGRLHLICGESQLGDLSLFLKLAVTSLIASMICAGIPLPQCVLASPVRAMRRFSRDVTLNAKARTVSGESVTALEIQRAYLEAVEAALGHPALPTWSADACARWRRALDSLEKCPVLESVDPRTEPECLDWRFKHALFTGVIEDSGFSWREVRSWNRVIRVMERSFRQVAPDEPPLYLTPLLLDSGKDPRLQRGLDSASPFVAKLGLDWAGLADFLRLRDGLQELDVKLMELGDDSLFAQLDRAGLFDHRVEGVESATVAIDHPPACGRAAIRGKMIRRLHRAGLGHRFVCGWQGIYDQEKHRILNLGDPFETGVRWTPSAPRRSPLSFIRISGNESSPGPRFPSGRILDHYDAGNYHAGWELIEDYRSQISNSGNPISPSSLPSDYFRFRAWFAARRGLMTESIEALAELRGSDSRLTPSSSCISDHVLALSNCGLVGDDSIEEWIDAGMRLARERADSFVDAPFLSNASCRRLRTGDTLQAQQWLDRALQPSAFDLAHAHTQARILAHRGECQRRMGDFASARDWLQRSEEQYTRGGFRGDYADFCLTYQAKLALSVGDSPRGLDLLNQALAIQQELGNPGQVRTLLLIARARRDTEPTVRDAVSARAQEFPSWAACPIMRRLLETEPWILWSEGHADERTDHAI